MQNRAYCVNVSTETDLIFRVYHMSILFNHFTKKINATFVEKTDVDDNDHEFIEREVLSR